MVTVSSNISFSSIFTCPHESEVLLLRKKSACNYMFSKNCLKLGRINCKLQESGIEENPTRNKASLRSRNRMEEYNIAMKRMMRNPSEYHHDLGLFPYTSIFYFFIFWFLMLIFHCHLQFWLCMCVHLSLSNQFNFLWWIGNKENIQMGNETYLSGGCGSGFFLRLAYMKLSMIHWFVVNYYQLWCQMHSQSYPSVNHVDGFQVLIFRTFGLCYFIFVGNDGCISINLGCIWIQMACFRVLTLSFAILCVLASRTHA